MKIKILAVLLIMIGISLLINNYLCETKSIKFHNEMINKIYINKGNYISNEYIGYIKIEDLGIKRLIKEGNAKEVLDNNFVLYINRSKRVGDTGNTVLAGHSINIVFSKLHAIKQNTEIVITTYDKTYKYRVIKIYETFPNDTSIYLDNGMKELTLVTCTNNNKKRLIIKAKYIT